MLQVRHCGVVFLLMSQSAPTPLAPAHLIATAAARLKESALNDLARNLVLAAIAGTEQVQAVLGGNILESTPHVDEHGDPDARLFLSSITVEGFRGIGKALTIELGCGPGLTVVQGANGVGKSSVAEGLELLFTDRLKRWDVKTRKDWRQSWRNLHHTEKAVVETRVRESGSSEQIVFRRTWLPDETSVEQGRTEIVRPANGGHEFTEQAWIETLRTWTPFVSPAAVQNTIDQPSEAYDVLCTTLGLDTLANARKRLTDARKPLREESNRLAEHKSRIIARLQGSADDRARTCLDAFQTDTADLRALQQIVDAVAAAEPDSTAALRSIVALTLPDADAIADRLADLATAKLSCAEFVGTDLERKRVTREILERALAFHEDHGDSPCPVCRSAPLDSAWRENTVRAIAQLNEEVRAIDDARDEFDSAVEAALALGESAASLTVPELTGFSATQMKAAQSDWMDAPPRSDPEAVSAHVEAKIGDLLAAASEVQSAASDHLATAETDWWPIALELQSWLANALKVDEGKPRVEALQAAEAWLKKFESDLISERFKPISADVQATFEQIKGLSNVDLGQPRLSGSGSKRNLALPASIAGRPTLAQALMSQGELAALGLSLFLSRLVQPTCPVGFAIIDDPLQSMDRSKTDGFAQALAKAARSRQLIVFTHDGRLAEAAHRLRLDATVLEMRRTSDSEVFMEQVADATTRYMEEARSLLESSHLSSDVRWRTVPNLLRSAVEAAAASAVMRTRIAQGVPHADAEEALVTAQTTKAKLAQAFGLDKKKQADLDEVLRRIDGNIPDVVNALNDLSHPRRAEPATVRSLFFPVEALIADLQRVS